MTGEPLLVGDPAQLEELIDRLVAVERYALDTEFHRERTYWPQLALVQVAWAASEAGPAGVALIDPLAVDVAPFARVLEGPGTMVAHAAEQDLEVLERACGTVPGRLLDTQVAAGFLGRGSASLSSLVSVYLDVRLPKADRLSDWSNRPLTAGQLRYAAADVAHLLELADVIMTELRAAGRQTWAEEECDALLHRQIGPGDPDRAWWKLRDSRQLRGPARGVAQEVTAWRERRARQVDQPVRFVVPDLAVQAIAHSQPAGPADLRQIRGLESRHLRGDTAEEILAAVARGRELPESALRLPPIEEVDRDLRPAVALAAAWVAQLARDQKIDAALLATRSDLAVYLRAEGKSRLSQGWRASMVGKPLDRLLHGDAALAFDGGGRLVLEARSYQPLTPEPAHPAEQDQPADPAP
jgi:ribonuclease D